MSSFLNPEATEMAPEATGGIFYYYSRRTEAHRGIHAPTGRDIEARLYRVFRALTGGIATPRGRGGGTTTLMWNMPTFQIFPSRSYTSVQNLDRLQ